MSEIAVNTLVTIMIVAFVVVITALIVVGGVWIIWFLVTSLIDAIREREEEEGET